MHDIEKPTLHRLHRTKLVQWAVAYAASAWVALQVLDFLGESFVWADAARRPATVLAVFGLLATLVVAWYHGEQGRQRVTLFEASALVVLALGAVASARIVEAADRPAAAFDVTDFDRSIAVLPFENLGTDEEQAYFASGFHDNLLTGLSRISALRVVSRRSVMRYADTDLDLAGIASELHVGALLEGSIQRDGNRIRVIVRLVDPRSDTQVWAQAYDRDLDDIFRVQSEITQRVAWALEAQLTEAEADRLDDAPTGDVTALDFYLRGVAAFERFSADESLEAMRLFEAAIEVDPTFAAAHARRADVFMQRRQFFGAATEVVDSARAAATMALELDPELALAHKAMGVVLWFEGDDEESLWRFHRAIDLDPNYAAAINNAGILNYLRGEMATALRLLTRATRLEPNVTLMRSNVGVAHLAVEQVDEARAWIGQALALDPELPSARNWNTVATLYEGTPDDALRLAEDYASDQPDESLSWSRAAFAAHFARAPEKALRYARRASDIAPQHQSFELAPTALTEASALAALGRTEEARAALADYSIRLEEEQARGRRGWYVPWRRAMTAAISGDHAAALDWIERTAEARFTFPRLLELDPIFDEVRDDPRFSRALARMEKHLEAERREASRGG